MISKNNVIDLSARRQKKDKQSLEGSSLEAKAPIVDMTERRQEMIQRDRRQVKRTILTEFVGAFAVVPSEGLMKVALHDISDSGVAFDIDTDSGKFNKGEEVAMRVYLNQSTYFPFVVKIENVRTVESLDDGDTQRHGASFSNDSVNTEALFHFVRFIETVSASLERDTGDVMVSNLKR